MKISPYPPCPKCNATRTRWIEYGVRSWNWFDALRNPFIEACPVDILLEDLPQYSCPKCGEKWGKLEIHRFSGRSVLIYWSPNRPWDGIALDMKARGVGSLLMESGVRVNRPNNDVSTNVVEQVATERADIVILTTHAVGRSATAIAKQLQKDSRTSYIPVFLWASAEDRQLITPDEISLFTKIVVDSDSTEKELHDLVIEHLKGKETKG